MEIIRANNTRLPGIFCYFRGRAVRIFIPAGFEFCYLGGIFERLKSILIQMIHAINWRHLAMLRMARYRKVWQVGDTPRYCGLLNALESEIRPRQQRYSREDK